MRSFRVIEIAPRKKHLGFSETPQGAEFPRTFYNNYLFSSPISTICLPSYIPHLEHTR